MVMENHQFRSMISQQSSSLGIFHPAGGNHIMVTLRSVCKLTMGRTPGHTVATHFRATGRCPPIDDFITQYEIFINKNGDLSEIYDR